MQPQGQNQYVRPYAPPIDFAADLHQQYWNCLNSLQAPLVESMQDKGVSLMQTTIALDRFIGNEEILEAMVLEEWMDENYNAQMEKIVKPQPKPGEKEASDWQWFHFAKARFRVITLMLHRHGFFMEKAVPHARI